MGPGKDGDPKLASLDWPKQAGKEGLGGRSPNNPKS